MKFVQEFMKMFKKKIVKQTSIGKTSVNEILIANKSRSYEMILAHELLEDNFNYKLEFCEEMMKLCDGNREFF